MTRAMPLPGRLRDRLRDRLPGRLPLGLLAGALVPLLVLSGCGGGDKAKKPTERAQVAAPTGNVQIPDGVHITDPGTKLSFGKPAVVAYEPNPKKSTVLQLTVRSVTKGSIRDLAMYSLDQRTRASVPYYVRVHVQNVGQGDVGNTPIPLWAVDSTNTLVQASSFTNQFRKCPSRGLPGSFAPSARADACLVYLVPNHGTLTGISFRPLQAYAPIEWTGKITVPKAPARKGKKKS